MVLKRNWQRGVADIVSLGVGILILGITTAGTTASMVYSREILTRQEHYKAAAFKLRGAMEEVIGKIEMNPNGWRNNPENLKAKFLRIEALEDPRDRDGIHPIYVTISQDRIEDVNLPETEPIDYYHVTLRASWYERDMPDSRNVNNRMARRIAFTTSVVLREDL
jgi:hypothetical protein